jgi:mannosyltransferase
MMHATTDSSPSLGVLPAARKRLTKAALNAWPPTLITLAAALLRFHAFTAKSIWLDEGFSLANARLPWPAFFAAMWRSELDMSSYFFLLHIWLWGGKTEALVRGLSVLISAATVPILYLLGTRLYGRATGLLAAWLLAINAFHVTYAQEVRAYALVVLLATLATWLFVRNLQEPATAHWNIYAIVSALTVYCHFYAALVIFAHFISLLFLRREQIAWRKILWSYGLFGAFMVPVAIFVMRISTGPIDWLPPVDAAELLRFGEGFSGNYGRTLYLLNVLMIGAAALFAARSWRAHRFKLESWGYLLVFLWLFVPLGIVLGASLKKPFFFPRYMSPILPAMVLLVAAGITRLRPAVCGWGFGIAISICSLLGTMAYYHMAFDVGHEDWRDASQYILERAQPGDSIFFYPPSIEAPFEFYRWQRKQDSTWPKILNGTFYSAIPGRNLPDIPGTEIPSAGTPGDRVWLVHLSITNSSGKPDLAVLAVRDWIATARRQVDAQRKFFPIDIMLFAKDTPPHDSLSSRGP